MSVLRAIGFENQTLIRPGKETRLVSQHSGVLSSPKGAAEFLNRHQRGDWGDLGEEDRQENEFSVDKRLRIFSAYHTSKGVKLWVITEADRVGTDDFVAERVLTIDSDGGARIPIITRKF